MTAHVWYYINLVTRIRLTLFSRKFDFSYRRLTLFLEINMLHSQDAKSLISIYLFNYI